MKFNGHHRHLDRRKIKEISDFLNYFFSFYESNSITGCIRELIHIAE
jgi:hypothetical protein